MVSSDTRWASSEDAPSSIEGFVISSIDVDAPFSIAILLSSLNGQILKPVKAFRPGGDDLLRSSEYQRIRPESIFDVVDTLPAESAESKKSNEGPAIVDDDGRSPISWSLTLPHPTKGIIREALTGQGVGKPVVFIPGITFQNKMRIPGEPGTITGKVT